jgi:hypothetical protein
MKESRMSELTKVMIQNAIGTDVYSSSSAGRSTTGVTVTTEASGAISHTQDPVPLLASARCSPTESTGFVTASLAGTEPVATADFLSPAEFLADIEVAVNDHT